IRVGLRQKRDDATWEAVARVSGQLPGVAEEQRALDSSGVVQVDELVGGNAGVPVEVRVRVDKRAAVAAIRVRDTPWDSGHRGHQSADDGATRQGRGHKEVLPPGSG